MTTVGTREVRTCEATGKPVVMEYKGETPDGGLYQSPNGNPGWLCLHDEDKADE